MSEVPTLPYCTKKVLFYYSVYPDFLVGLIGEKKGNIAATTTRIGGLKYIHFLFLGFKIALM